MKFIEKRKQFQTKLNNMKYNSVVLQYIKLLNLLVNYIRNTDAA